MDALESVPLSRRSLLGFALSLGALAAARLVKASPPPSGPAPAATVTIENTYRLLDEEKMPLPRAALHGAAEIAVPTLVSTLAISCVFTSVVFLQGPAKYLFTPMGLAVVFAMLASYSLSRTLTPITIGQMLKGQHSGGSSGTAGETFFSRFHASFERGFERLRQGYVELLRTLLTRRGIVPIIAILVLSLGVVMFIFVGRDFYPAIDGGMIQLHVRAPPGTRIDEMESAVRTSFP